MFIIDDIVKGIAQRKAGKEQAKANEKNLQADFESRSAAEKNAEDSRLARAQALGQALQGNRALSPEVLAAIMTRKAMTTRKGAMADPSKGAMWNALGSGLTSAGNLATQYLTGLGTEKILKGGGGASGAAPTSLAPPIKPVSMGGQSFDFMAPNEDWRLK